MTSEVDLCNLALSHLGDEADIIAISPPDGSRQAAHCARFYPLARDAVLQSFPWSFATKRITLAAMTNPSPHDWQYAYALPATCLRPLSALTPGMPAANFGNDESDAGSFPYVLETGQDGIRVLYTNVQTAVLRYVDKVTDTTAFPPLVVLAISRLLASFLAGPILKGETGIKVADAHGQRFKVELAAACAADARLGRRDSSQYRPPWIVARDVGGSHWNIPPYGPVG